MHVTLVVRCDGNAAVIWQLAGILLLLAPAYFVVVPLMTRKWPTARAKVVVHESNARDGIVGWVIDPFTRTDYGIEYVVDGREFSKNLNIEGYIRVDGFRKHYFPLVPQEFDVRYHPDDPGHYSIAHAFKTWVKWSTSIVCIVLGLSILSSVWWPNGT